MMNRNTLVTLLLPVLGALCAAPHAQAQMKSCEQLRDEIASRIRLPADSFRLEIVAKDEAGPGRMMGSCEGGTRKVVFITGEAVATAPAPTPEPKPGPERKPDPQPDPQPIAPPDPQPQPQPQPQPAPDVADHPALTQYRWAVDPETVKQYLAWIAEARAKHPYADPEDRMIFLMSCESKGNAAIVGAGKYIGLFQYTNEMWAESWNEYRALGIKNAQAQIFATAKAWSLGKQRRWDPTCYPRTPSVARN